MLLESTRLTAQLAADGLIRDVGDFLPGDYLQQFIPDAAEAMRVEGRLYGIPESLTVLALYVNTALAPEPLVNLDEVSFAISTEQPFALPANFFFGYWGMAAFGGFGFDPASGAVVDSAGLTGWLAWLRQVQGHPGIDLTGDFTAAEAQFARGEAAYFISGPWSLAAVLAELDQEQVRVTLLPAGTAGPGRPILQVTGTMISAAATDGEAALAAAFGRYLAGSESQAHFLQTGSHISALVGTDLSGYPLLNAFREQAKTAAVVSENNRFATIQRLGDDLYRAVLVEGADPAEAVAAFEAAVLDANQEVSETPAGD
jgi:maltose-binding protein MalE